MNIDEALSRLYALASRGARPGVDAMREACAREGDPQDAFESVHVAGTNGKGSVCATVEAIARAAGLNTGLYSSPHLGRFAERIRVNGASIDDETLAREIAYVLDTHKELTFFEVATLIAFRVFRERAVDLAVIEVGLGGRLDATNVLARPRAVAISTIGFDHTEYLGDSIESIAAEKAGIVKPSVPVVAGALPAAAARVVEAKAAEVGAGPVWFVGREIERTRRANSLVVTGPLGRSVVVEPALAGAHQDDNAAVAVALAWLARLPSSKGGVPVVMLPLEDVAIARGVESVRWPGRLEELTLVDESHGELSGTFVLDGAHNEEGARALAIAVERRAEPRPSRALVFGAMADKAWGAMVSALKGAFAYRIYVEPEAIGGKRKPASVERLVAFDEKGESALSLREALALARRRVGPEGVVVVAGSLYLVGEARALLTGEARDPQVGL